ncbi:MAG: hypothetical protein WD715_15135 [Dongiaceae bacterium]
MNAETGRKLIVAYIARGLAHEVASGLHERLGLDALHYSHGRGSGTMHTMTGSEMTEVDFLSVVVTEAQAEEVFAFMYEAGQIGRPGGGLIAQLPLRRAAAIGLSLPAEPAA